MLIPSVTTTPMNATLWIQGFVPPTIPTVFPPVPRTVSGLE